MQRRPIIALVILAVFVAAFAVRADAQTASFTASITYPALGATVGGTQTVGMSSTAPWGQSKTFALKVDGTNVASQVLTGTTLWYGWNTKTVADGTHTLTLAVTYNGATATASRSVTVKNGITTTMSPSPTPAPSPLAVSFTNPAVGATVSGAARITGSSSGGASGSHTFSVSFTGPTAVTTMSQTVTGTTASFPWDTTKASNGGYTLTLTVKDSAGATATTTRSVTVSNATTTTTASFTASITYPASGAIVSGTKSVGMSTTAPWGQSKTFTLKADGAVVTTQVLTGTTLWYTWNTATIPDGSHTLTLAVTYAGATATASLPVTVKNGTPTTSTTTTPTTSTRTLPDRLYGVTLDAVDHLSDIITSLRNLSHMPTTRVVFDEFVAPSYYVTPVTQIHDVSYIVGEILDSSAVSKYSVTDYVQRTTDYLNALGDKVDLWEVGNEINGEWLGTTTDVVQKMQGAYNLVKQRGARAALTLYYNQDCWASADHEMFTWAQANVPATMKQGLDYVLISYYEDDCNGLQPDWTSVFTTLGQMFPNSKIGFGENGTLNPALKASYIQRYYAMQILVPRYVSGHFWWYGKEDFVPMTNPLWSIFNDVIKNN